MNNVRCCGLDAYWVENVPGKGYMFCGECKNEVVETQPGSLPPMSKEELAAFENHLVFPNGSQVYFDPETIDAYLNFDGTLYLDVKY